MSTMQTVDSPRLTTALAKSGLSNPELVEIRDTFQPLFSQAEQLVKGAEEIVVTDATQVSEMKAARAARLELKSIRVESEKQRKALKESALRRGQVIDEVGRLIKGFVEPVEDRLLAMEEFAERAEAERKAKLGLERERKVMDAGGDPRHYQLGEMPEASFAALLDGLLRAQREAKEAAAKAEADRIAKEKADREERAKLQAERDTAEKERQKALAELKKANAERDAAEDVARKERENADRKARAEIEAAEKARRAAEAELAAKKAAEKKAAADAEKARLRAERAPDAEKLRAVAAVIRAVQVPAMQGDAGVIGAQLRRSLDDLAGWAEDTAASLTE